MDIVINDNKYEVIKNKNNCLDIDLLYEYVTDYFYDYDYIFGDYSYDKLRLKGFCCDDNIKCNSINNINNLDNYIKDFCSYECDYFLIKKSS